MSLISQSPFVFLKHILKPSTRYPARFQRQLPYLTTPSYQQHHFFASTPNLKMSASDATAKIFFSSPKFAVVGASTNTEKFGYKGSFCPILLPYPHPFPTTSTHIIHTPLTPIQSSNGTQTVTSPPRPSILKAPPSLSTGNPTQPSSPSRSSRTPRRLRFLSLLVPPSRSRRSRRPRSSACLLSGSNRELSMMRCWHMRMRISRRSWLGREVGEGRGGVFWLMGREVWLLLGCR